MCEYENTDDSSCSVCGRTTTRPDQLSTPPDHLNREPFQYITLCIHKLTHNEKSPHIKRKFKSRNGSYFLRKYLFLDCFRKSGKSLNGKARNHRDTKNLKAKSVSHFQIIFFNQQVFIEK